MSIVFGPSRASRRAASSGDRPSPPVSVIAKSSSSETDQNGRGFRLPLCTGDLTGSTSASSRVTALRRGTSVEPSFLELESDPHQLAIVDDGSSPDPFSVRKREMDTTSSAGSPS